MNKEQSVAGEEASAALLENFTRLDIDKDGRLGRADLNQAHRDESLPPQVCSACKALLVVLDFLGGIVTREELNTLDGTSAEEFPGRFSKEYCAFMFGSRKITE